MGLFSQHDARFAEAVAGMVYSNPFLPQRIAYERAALGAGFDERNALWNINTGQENQNCNVDQIVARAENVLAAAHRRLASVAPTEAELGLYEDLTLLLLYHRWQSGFDQVLRDGLSGRTVAIYEPLVRHAEQYLVAGDRRLPLLDQMPHVVACLFQLRRAFYNIFSFIIGTSRSAVALRAAIWQSIFTHDMHRYRRKLFDRMGDYTTLIIGQSGTGKELAAQAVGLSRYIPFDAAKRTFAEDSSASFFALNLSALSPTLIESELFGHQRGSFTGAVADRAGWLEVCPGPGTVFLDEIGELDPALQVKLLRVLQSRTFSRLGETGTRQFRGKIIASTNRDLSAEMQRGNFREDLYYRLCSDIIVTPTLRQRLADDPDELRHLIVHMAQRIVGEEAPAVAEEVLCWIHEELGDEYAWPGNVRELEQCVRNVLIRQQYRPPRAATSPAPLPDAASLGVEAMSNVLRNCDLTADEMLRVYCTAVYARTGSYEAAARRLGLDRRTVKAKVDRAMLNDRPVLNGNRNAEIGK